MKVVGTREVDFKDKDGNAIKGVNVYVEYSYDKVTGVVAEKIFLSAAKLGSYSPKVGDDISVVYNKYGKVDHVDVAD